MALIAVVIQLLTMFLLKAGAQSVLPPRDLWCVAKNNAAEDALKTAVSWACGPGAANCAPIQTGGPCYNPADIQDTASWAFNDYYLKNGLTDEACNFAGVAALTSLNPSHGSCKFPSSLSVSNGSTSTPFTVLGPAAADWSSDQRQSSRGRPLLMLALGIMTVLLL